MSEIFQPTEQSAKTDFLEAWEIYKQMKAEGQSTPTSFNVDNFYQGAIKQNLDHLNRFKKYTKDDIRRFLLRPEDFERQIREVSQYLYATCQEYKNLINYRANMLTHDYILVPDGMFNKDEKAIENSFYKTLNFLDDYNIKSKFRTVESISMREDVYFAYERTDGQNFVWQQLPTNYCRILGTDAYETYTFEFNFSYFDKGNVNIDNFDEEFHVKYKLYSQDRHGKKWQKLNPEKAICFKFDKSVVHPLPPFSGIFDELLGLEDYKDLQENSSQGNNYKLLHQKIPMKNDKDAKANQFLIDDKSAVKFHNNVKANIPRQIGVVTTPMEVTGITLNKTTVEEDIVARAEANLFTSAGVSQLLFNADKAGSIGLNRSIENDSSIMFSFNREYEKWLRKRLRQTTKSYRWKVIMLDITEYNRKDKVEEALKLAQFGYSKFFVSASLGLSQSDFLGLNNLENQLNLIEDMKPLVSSHTQTLEDGGRKAKDENKLSDKGLDQKDNNRNANRTK